MDRFSYDYWEKRRQRAPRREIDPDLLRQAFAAGRRAQAHKDAEEILAVMSGRRTSSA